LEEYTEDWKLDCNGEERRPLPTPVLLDRYQNKDLQIGQFAIG